MSAGIDYGMGTVNIDKETGIRYGVIHQHDVMQAWADGAEAYYGDPSCPKCGNKVERYDIDKHGDYESNSCNDYACEDCSECFPSDEVFGYEPLGFNYDGDGYQASQGEDGDIFIVKSPYFTLCKFCSPCAPGAGYIMDSVDDGIRAYCFGHDWFEDGKAPYPVYSVETGEEVLPG